MKKLSDINLTEVLERAVKGIGLNSEYSDGTPVASLMGGAKRQITKSYNMANIPGKIGLSYKVQTNPTTGIPELQHITPVILNNAQKVTERYPNLARLERIGYKRIPKLNEAGEKVSEDLVPNILNPHEWEHEELFPDRKSREQIQGQLQDYVSKRGIANLDDTVRGDLENIVSNHFRSNPVVVQPSEIGTGYTPKTGTYSLGQPYSSDATSLSNIELSGYDSTTNKKVKQYISNVISNSKRDKKGNIQLGIGDYSRDEVQEMILKEAREYAQAEGLNLTGTANEQTKQALGYVNDIFFNIPKQSKYEARKGILPQQTRIQGGMSKAWTTQTEGIEGIPEITDAQGNVKKMLPLELEEAAVKTQKDINVNYNPIAYRLINKKTGSVKLVSPENYNKGYFFSAKEQEFKGYEQSDKINETIAADLERNRDEWDIKKVAQGQLGVGAGIDINAKYHLYDPNSDMSSPVKIAYGSEFAKMEVDPNRGTVFYDETTQEGQGRRATFGKQRRELLPVLVDESEQHPLLIDAPVSNYKSYEQVRQEQELPTNQNPSELIRKSKQASFDAISPSDNIYQFSEPTRQKFIQDLMMTENNERSLEVIDSKTKQNQGAMLRFEDDYLEKPEETYLAWRAYNDGWIEGSKNLNALSRKRSEGVNEIITVIRNGTKGWSEFNQGAVDLLKNGIDSQDATKSKSARDYLKGAIEYHLGSESVKKGKLDAQDYQKGVNQFLYNIGANDIDDAINILGKQVQGALYGGMRVSVNQNGIRFSLDPEGVRKVYQERKKNLDDVAQRYYGKNLGELAGLSQSPISAKSFWEMASKPAIKAKLDKELGQGWEESDYLPDILRATNPRRGVQAPGSYSGDSLSRNNVIPSSLNDAVANLTTKDTEGSKLLVTYTNRTDGFGIPSQVETKVEGQEGYPKLYGQKTTEARPLTFDGIVGRIKAAKYMAENPVDERVKRIFQFPQIDKKTGQSKWEGVVEKAGEEAIPQIKAYYKGIGFDDDMADHLAQQVKARWIGGMKNNINPFDYRTSVAEYGRGSMRSGTEHNMGASRILNILTNPESVKQQILGDIVTKQVNKQIESYSSKEVPKLPSTDKITPEFILSSKKQSEEWKEATPSTKMTWQFLNDVKAGKSFSNPALEEYAQAIRQRGIEGYQKGTDAFTLLENDLTNAIRGSLDLTNIPMRGADGKTKTTRNVVQEVNQSIDAIRSQIMSEEGLTEEWIANKDNQEKLGKKVIDYYQRKNPKTNAAIKEAARRQGTEELGEANYLDDIGYPTTVESFIGSLPDDDFMALGNSKYDKWENGFTTAGSNESRNYEGEVIDRQADMSSPNTNLDESASLYDSDEMGLDDIDEAGFKALEDILAQERSNENIDIPTTAIQGHNALERLANDSNVSIQGLTTKIDRQMGIDGLEDVQKTRDIAKQNNIYNRKEFFRQNPSIRKDPRYLALVSSLAQLKQVDNASEDDVLRVVDPAHLYVTQNKGIRPEDGIERYSRALDTYRQIHPEGSGKQLGDELPVNLPEKQKIIYQQALADAIKWTSRNEDEARFRQSVTPEANKTATISHLEAITGTEMGNRSRGEINEFGSEGTGIGDEGYVIDTAHTIHTEGENGLSNRNVIQRMFDEVFTSTSSASAELSGSPDYVTSQGYYQAIKRAFSQKEKTSGQALKEARERTIGQIHANAVARGWSKGTVDSKVARTNAEFDAKASELGDELNVKSYQALARSIADGIRSGAISKSEYHDFVQRVVSDTTLKESDIQDFLGEMQLYLKPSRVQQENLSDIDLSGYMDEGIENAELPKGKLEDLRERREKTKKPVYEVAGKKMRAFFNKKAKSDNPYAKLFSEGNNKGFTTLLSNLSDEEKGRVVIHTGDEIEVQGLEPTRKQLGILKENLWALKEKLGMLNPNLDRETANRLKIEIEQALADGDQVKMARAYNQLHLPEYRGAKGRARQIEVLEASPLYQELKLIPTTGTWKDNERMGLAPDKSNILDQDHPFAGTGAYGELYQQAWAKDTRDFPYPTNRYTVPGNVSPLDLEAIPLSKIGQPGKKVNLSLKEVEDIVDNRIQESINMGRSDIELREKAGLTDEQISSLRTKQAQLTDEQRAEVEQVASDPEEYKEQLLRGVLLRNVEENDDINPIDDFLGRAFVQDDTGALRPLTPEVGLNLGGQELSDTTRGITYRLDEQGNVVPEEEVKDVQQAVGLNTEDNPDALYLAQSTAKSSYTKALGLYQQAGLVLPDNPDFKKMSITDKAIQLRNRAHNYYKGQLNQLQGQREELVKQAGLKENSQVNLERASQGVRDTTIQIGELQKQIDEIRNRAIQLGEDVRPQTRQILNNQLSSLQAEMNEQIARLGTYREAVNQYTRKPVEELVAPLDKQIAQIQEKLQELEGVGAEIASAKAFANITNQLYTFNDFNPPTDAKKMSLSQLEIQTPKASISSSSSSSGTGNSFIAPELGKVVVKGGGSLSLSEVSENMAGNTGIRIISGGQTGVDRYGLDAAKKHGLATGGTAPLGYKVEKGRIDTSLKDMGLTESHSSNYTHRTMKNIEDADVTLIMGNLNSPGSAQTIEMAKSLGKSYLTVSLDDLDKYSAKEIANAFLGRIKPDDKVINIAGNRESKLLPVYRQKIQAVLDLVMDGLKKSNVTESGSVSSKPSAEPQSLTDVVVENKPATLSLDKYIDRRETNEYGMSFSSEDRPDDIALEHLMFSSSTQPEVSTNTPQEEIKRANSYKSIDEPEVSTSTPKSVEETQVTLNTYQPNYKQEGWDKALLDKVKSDLAEGKADSNELFKGALNDFLSSEVTGENVYQKLDEFQKLWIISSTLPSDEQVKGLQNNLQAVVTALGEENPDIKYANAAINAVRKNIAEGKGVTGQTLDPFNKQFFEGNINPSTRSTVDKRTSVVTPTTPVPPEYTGLDKLVIDDVGKTKPVIPANESVSVRPVTVNEPVVQTEASIPTPVQEIPVTTSTLSSTSPELVKGNGMAWKVGAGVGAGAIGLAFLNNYLQQKEKEKQEQAKRDRLRQMVGSGNTSSSR